MRQINGVSEISHKYDIVLLDQFGVIHDGRTPYPNALNAIRRLHETGLKIVILSNSSKEADIAKQKVTKMGVDPDAIHGIITSGQLTLGYVKNLMKSRPNARVLHMNWASTRGTISLSDHDVTHVAPVSLSSTGYVLVAPESVDFILAHGTDGVTGADGRVQKMPLESLRGLCRTMARRAPQTPFICANPDFVTVDGGTLRTMPGTLARDYEMEGGSVVRLGKPGNQAYEMAIKACGEGRILAIGDSLAHDVLGAAKRNIDSLYIAGGIHAPLFQIKPEDGFNEQVPSFQWDEKVIEKLVEEEAPELGTRRPTYISDFFRW
ncbi:Haloacid dehalogenase-like hydrolase [Gracilaria domingensis]|nr:Haloacid dehalogenase-like hydrolase [Gracilaria domingensis]